MNDSAPWREGGSKYVSKQVSKLCSFFWENRPKERTQNSEHGESLKSKVIVCCVTTCTVDAQLSCGSCRSYRRGE